MTKVVLSVLLIMFTSIANVNAAEINVSGSTSVARIMDILAEDFNKQHSDSFVAVQGVGSTAGVTLVQSGVAEIGMSSRNLTEEEYQNNLVVKQIAYDGLAVVVNHKNNSDNLTREQLFKIYKGEITNWKELGGDDRVIAVVTREISSGTRFAFENQLGLTKILNNRRISDISPNHLVANSNSMVKTLITDNQQAIGFISMGSVDASIKPLNINGVEPTSDNLLNKKYKLSRPFLIFYHQDQKDKNALKFAKFVTSEQAQQLITDHGYTPYSEE